MSITKPDKGVVIFDRTNYIDPMNYLLSDPLKFEDSDP